MANFHASAVLVADRGVLVAGASGAGKTGLCLALLSYCHGYGVPARMVADDQVLLSAAGGRPIATAPASIAGLVEVRGYGPAPVQSESRMVVDLLVRLVAPREAPRMADGGPERLAGCDVPRLSLPSENPDFAARAVAAFLRLPPFTAR